MKGDFHLLQQIQQTQNKTAKQHRDKIQELVAVLFEETTDPMLAAIKQDLFSVENGGPIVSLDHRVITNMMALPAPPVNHIRYSSDIVYYIIYDIVYDIYKLISYTI